jgi:hypothetical protein
MLQAGLRRLYAAEEGEKDFYAGPPIQAVGRNRVYGLTRAHMIPFRENQADHQGKPLPLPNAVQCSPWRTLN